MKPSYKMLNQRKIHFVPEILDIISPPLQEKEANSNTLTTCDSLGRDSALIHTQPTPNKDTIKSFNKKNLVKVFSKSIRIVSPDNLMSIQKHIKLITNSDNPDVIDISKFTGICMVMELIDIDLADLFDYRAVIFNEKSLMKIVYNSLCSLAFMHEANIIHRDLKPANMFISKDMDVKIGDLGYARQVVDKILYDETIE
jgi:serine/threonine protein kinase